MVFDISVAIAWILYLALFPIAFFWLRRAYRILFRRDFSEVALKGGLAPPNAEKFAPWEAVINAVAGIVIVFVIFGVLLGVLEFDRWVAIAGSTIWSKFFASFAVGRHAHALAASKKKR